MATTSAPTLAHKTTPRTSLPGDTIPAKFCLAVQQRGNAVALRQKRKGVWQEMSWQGLGKQARFIAMGLVSLGFSSGDVAAVLSNARWQWAACDYGILLAGGVSCGIDPGEVSPYVADVCRDSAARFVFVEDDEQLDKLLEVRRELPLLRKVIVIDPQGLEALDDPQVMTLDALQLAGEVFDGHNPGLFSRRAASRGPRDSAVLVYTTGAGGKSESRSLSHRHLCQMLETAWLALPQDEADDKLAFLPPSDAVERVAGLYMSLQTGSRLNYVENTETVFQNLRELAPTILVAPQQVWAKLHAAAVQASHDATPLQQSLHAWAIRSGSEAAARSDAGQGLSLTRRLQLAWAQVLVLGNARRFTGMQRLRWASTGAEALSPELLQWFRAIGVQVLDGKGMDWLPAADTAPLAAVPA